MFAIAPFAYFKNKETELKRDWGPCHGISMEGGTVGPLALQVSWEPPDLLSFKVAFIDLS